MSDVESVEVIEGFGDLVDNAFDFIALELLLLEDLGEGVALDQLEKEVDMVVGFQGIVDLDDVVVVDELEQSDFPQDGALSRGGEGGLGVDLEGVGLEVLLVDTMPD